MYDAASTLSNSEFARFCELLDGHKPSTLAEYGAAPPRPALRCCGCSRELSAGGPTPGRPVKLAACSACGRRQFVDDSRVKRTVLEGAALSSAAVYASVFREADSTRCILERALGIAYGAAENRREVRSAVAAPVTCVALDRSLAPLGLAFESMLLDVSRHGARLVTQDDTPAVAMLLDFSDAGCLATQVIAAVRWQRPERGSATTVGCEFLHAAGEPLPEDVDSGSVPPESL